MVLHSIGVGAAAVDAVVLAVVPDSGTPLSIVAVVVVGNGDDIALHAATAGAAIAVHS